MRVEDGNRFGNQIARVASRRSDVLTPSGLTGRVDAALVDKNVERLSVELHLTASARRAQFYAGLYAGGRAYLVAAACNLRALVPGAENVLSNVVVSSVVSGAERSLTGSLTNVSPPFSSIRQKGASKFGENSVSALHARYLSE